MRKTLLLILGIIILQLNFSCKSQYSSIELNNNFTSEEISDLNKIVEFFTSQICENSNKNFALCYKEILPELNSYGWSPIMDRVNFVKQKELYSNISNSTFIEIWSFYKMTKVKEEVDYKSINVNLNGKYIKFLEELSRNNSQIEKYYNAFIETGTFNSNGSLQNQIIEYPNQFDLNNPNIQLIISIQHLWENDINKRIDKWE